MPLESKSKRGGGSSVRYLSISFMSAAVKFFERVGINEAVL